MTVRPVASGRIHLLAGLAVLGAVCSAVLLCSASALAHARHGSWRAAPHRLAAGRTAHPSQTLQPDARLLWDGGSPLNVRPSTSRLSPRIIGGGNVGQGQWGFMAFILHFDSSGNADFSCSGTLVSSNVVLTAGHCAVAEATGAPLQAGDYRVVTGAVDWTDTGNRHVSAVSQVVVAPNFDPSIPAHDAALLVLSAPVGDPAVRLWATGQVSAGTSAVITGWGRTHSGQTTPQTVLQSAATVVQGANYCSQPFLAGYSYDAASELCAVNPPAYDTGTCNGDSGGPLLAKGSGGNWIEIGLTSVGPASCDTTAPDYYTAIAPIASWVNAQVRAAAPPPPADSGAGTSGTGSGSAAGSGAGAGSGSSSSSSGTGAPATHPSPLTLQEAQADVRQTLVHALAGRINVPADPRTACGSLSAVPVRCSFAFLAARHRYSGTVRVYSYVGAGSQSRWTARYTVRWVRARCSSRSRHRAACTVHRRSGSW